MDIMTIGLTIVAWSKYGNPIISIIALVCSIIQTVGSFRLFHRSGHSAGSWGSIVGTICLVLCIVKVFGV